MEKCCRCGAETKLQSDGVPLCLVCTFAEEAKPKPDPQKKTLGGLTVYRNSNVRSNS
jgi:hypothetical protein